jgi:hypothetical protein
MCGIGKERTTPKVQDWRLSGEVGTRNIHDLAIVNADALPLSPTYEPPVDIQRNEFGRLLHEDFIVGNGGRVKRP